MKIENTKGVLLLMNLPCFTVKAEGEAGAGRKDTVYFLAEKRKIFFIAASVHHEAVKTALERDRSCYSGFSIGGDRRTAL